MLVLKIVLITVAALLLLIASVLLLNLKIAFSFSTTDTPKLLLKVLFFRFDLLKSSPEKAKKPEKKKNGRLVSAIKKALGLDELSSIDELKSTAEKKGIGDTAAKIITLLSLFANRLGWLLKKFRLRKFNLFVICGGGDAADAAIEYGLVCAAVYPFAGYLDTNVKSRRNAQNIQIGCDFESENELAFESEISVRIMYLLYAVLGGVTDLYETTKEAQE